MFGMVLNTSVIINFRYYLYSSNIYPLKSTIETIEKVAKYVQSYQWRHQDDAKSVILVSLLLTLNLL